MESSRANHRSQWDALALPQQPMRSSRANHLSQWEADLALATAARLHLEHVLGESERQLYELENGVTHTLERLDAGGEGEEQDVQPGNEEADWPAEEDETQEPEYGPYQSRTQIGFTATFAFAHCCLLYT